MKSRNQESDIPGAGKGKGKAGLRAAVAAGLVYQGNPKHKHPWVGGRRGSLCPREITVEQAQAMLQSSMLHGKKRYGVDASGRPYCAQASDVHHGRWHGYPVKWREVPSLILKQVAEHGLVSRKQIDEAW